VITEIRARDPHELYKADEAEYDEMTEFSEVMKDDPQSDGGLPNCKGADGKMSDRIWRDAITFRMCCII
jgi:hypothetical protein